MRVRSPSKSTFPRTVLGGGGPGGSQQRANDLRCVRSPFRHDGRNERARRHVKQAPHPWSWPGGRVKAGIELQGLACHVHRLAMLRGKPMYVACETLKFDATYIGLPCFAAASAKHGKP